jgi:hypothetical protein
MVQQSTFVRPAYACTVARRKKLSIQKKIVDRKGETFEKKTRCSRREQA